MTGTQVVPWGMALAVFIGTLPIFGVIVWYVIEVRLIRIELSKLTERRVATFWTQLHGNEEGVAN